MPNIVLSAVGILVAITSTLVAASPTEPRSSNTIVNLTFVPSSLTTGDSVSQETIDMTDVTDSPNSRTGLRTSLSVPPQTSTETLPSSEGITGPTILTETTVFGVVDTEDPQALATGITTRVDTTVVDVATPQEEVEVVASQEVDTATPQEEVDKATPQEEVDTVTSREEVEAVAPQEEVNTVTPQEVNTATPQEVDTVAPQQEVDTATPQEEDDTVKVFSREEVKLAPLQDEVSTASHLEKVNSAAIRKAAHPVASEANTAASEEEVRSTALQRVTTSVPTDKATQETGDSAVVILGKMDKVPTRPDQLVKCFCGGQEVLTSSGCQRFQAGTIIHMQKRFKTIGLVRKI